MTLFDAGSRRRRFRRMVGLLTLALAFAEGSKAMAQEDPMLPIRLGRILFYPSATLSYENNDNITRANEDDRVIPPTASGIQDFRPSLRFEMPFERSFISFAYSPKVREYSSKELEGANGTSHYVDFAGQFQVLPSLRFDVRDQYVDGISELAEIDPGGELRFGIQPFRSNGGVAILEMNLGPIQSLEVGGSQSKVHFEPPPSGTGLPDFQSTGMFARYVIAMDAENRVYLSLDRKDVSQQRGRQDLLLVDYRTRSAGVGIRRVTGPGLMSDLQVSYAFIDSMQRESAPFHGFTYEGTFANQIGPSIQTVLKLRRAPMVSFFNNNAFYVNEMVSLSYQQFLGRRIRVQLTGGYQYNFYPRPLVAVLEANELHESNGEKRNDRLRNFSAQCVFRMGRGVDLSVGYRRDQSRSNILATQTDDKGNKYPPFSIYSYDSQGVMASLIFGWQ